MVMANPKVLVLDDHPDTLRLVETFLSLSGFDVVAAANGADGLALALNGIDAIATDLAMPEMDGFEFVRRLRTARARPSIPIVAVTGQSFDVEATLAAMIGCCRVIQKPCDLAVLADTLRSLVNTCVHECGRCPNRAIPMSGSPHEEPDGP
jgi:CheY-like chemotaxis protein